MIFSSRPCTTVAVENTVLHCGRPYRRGGRAGFAPLTLGTIKTAMRKREGLHLLRAGCRIPPQQVERGFERVINEQGAASYSTITRVKRAAGSIQASQKAGQNMCCTRW